MAVARSTRLTIVPSAQFVLVNPSFIVLDALQLRPILIDVNLKELDQSPHIPCLLSPTANHVSSKFPWQPYIKIIESRTVTMRLHVVLDLTSAVSPDEYHTSCEGSGHQHLQILEEVGSNVTDVAISPDGSWKVVTENDENVENLSPAVLDLTRDENEMEASGNTQIPMVNQSSSDSMELSSREFMNMTPDNSANMRPQIRMMRGSITPGSTRYDHLIIQPTQRPVQSQSQAQTLPPPQPTAYDYVPVQSQAQTFLANPSYPVGTNETQAGSSLLPLEEGVAPLGSFWSMPRET
ncbi:hypothetical protein Bca4012_070072 [Brassica carinata]